MTQAYNLSQLANKVNTSGQIDVSTGITGTVPIANGGTGTTSTTFVNAATNVTGTLSVANGGTGAATLTANNVLLGNGTSAVQVVAPGSNGNVLRSNGTTWTSSALTLNYVPTDVSNGVGSFNVGIDGVSSVLTNLSTTASFRGAMLRGGAASFSSASLAGTWRNVSGNTLDSDNGEYGVFQRIS